MSDSDNKTTSNHKGSSADNKKKRRPRSAAGERNFMCGCSKAYLSYPALYTHVKNKHNGEFPEGSCLKKKSKKVNEGEEDFKESVSKTYYPGFDDFCRSIGVFEASSVFKDKEDVKTEFPKDDVFTSSEYYQHFFGEFCKFADQDPKDLKTLHEEGCNPENPTETSCDEILSLFLLHMSKRVSRVFFKEMAAIICLLRKALNEDGYKFMQKLSPDIVENTDNFCSGMDIQVVPEISNIFIVVKFRNYFDVGMNQKREFQYIGKENKDLMNVIKIINFLCNWLLICGFTQIKLDLNTDP